MITVFRDYYFYADGRFQQYTQYPANVEKIEGKYSVSNGKVYFKERKFYKFSPTVGEIAKGTLDKINNQNIIMN